MQNWYNQARSKRLSDYKTSKVSGKSFLGDRPEILGEPIYTITLRNDFNDGPLEMIY